MPTPRTRRPVTLIVGLLAALLYAAPATADDAPPADGFSFKDTPGDHLDVLLGGKTVARYQYAHDTSTPARRAETYKPYLHVFDAEGDAPITKGPGGLYTHHRGIFIGWRKITFNGKEYDRWHMIGGDIVHQKFLAREADADHATFTSLTHWSGDRDVVMIEEERTTTLRRAPAPARLLIETTFKLTAPSGAVTLDGDPEHAGVHFRPANEVDPAKTTYVFPKTAAKPHADTDYPWLGETFTLNGKRYSVVELNHPDNPKGTRFSAYRDYGRIGAFPKARIDAGQSLTLKYGFLIADGEMPPADVVEKAWDGFAGVKDPTPAPPTTAEPAEHKAAPTEHKAEPVEHKAAP